MGFTKNNYDFFQSKYKFYSKFNFWIVVLGSIASIGYFVSDCLLYGRFAYETFIPRMIIVLPLILYIIVYPRCDSYRIMVPFSYFMAHFIVWDTIFAIFFLTDRSHADEGFVILQLLFFALGFAAPIAYATVGHCLVLVDILVSNMFIHYQDISVMISLSVPCVAAICGIHFVMQKLYRQHFDATKQLERLSKYDNLTDVYNRNILNLITDENSYKLISTIQAPVTVMIMDIDFFKRVNDTYGHTSGDRVLKHTAGVVKASVGNDNYVVRWGGEEFLIILSNTELEKGVEIADDLRRSIEQSDNGVCKTTVSIGVASYNMKDYRQAVNAADLALYKAKNNGRNRVEY